MHWRNAKINRHYKKECWNVVYNSLSFASIASEYLYIDCNISLNNHSVWESLEHYEKAINKLLFSSDPQSPILKYDDESLVISPHLFRKVAVPGICEEWVIFN